MTAPAPVAPASPAAVIPALVAESEALLVAGLALRPLPLPAALARAEGTWRDERVRIETRAYAGGAVAYARFVTLAGEGDGDGLAIGNLLCVPGARYPLPILGGDFVSLGARAPATMLAVDLSPTLPAGPARDAQLAAAAPHLARRDRLPPGGELPDWCAAWFSPLALYTRVGADRLAEGARAVAPYARAFAALARAATPAPAPLPFVAAATEGYAAAHRTDDKGLGLLAKMFGAEWAARYVAEVLFPPAMHERGAA